MENNNIAESLRRTIAIYEPYSKFVVIKAGKENMDKVLDAQEYYSSGKPRQEYDFAIIIGDSEDNKIPILAIGKVNDISKLSVANPINPIFEQRDTWRYRWDLSITIVPLKINILEFFDEMSPSYRSLLNCQKLGYVNLCDLKAVY